MRVIATLHSLASMVEGVAMAIIAVADGAIESAAIVGWLVVLIVAAVATWFLFLWPYILAERMRGELCCTRKQAVEINQYLDEIGIPWITFHEWVQGAMNKFMPMLFFDTGKNEQLFAHWSEVRKAVIKLAVNRKLDPKWKKPDAIAAIGLEVMMQRRAEGRNLFDPDSEPADLGKFAR